jgi:hypothetical protein
MGRPGRESWRVSRMAASVEIEPDLIGVSERAEELPDYEDPEQVDQIVEECYSPVRAARYTRGGEGYHYFPHDESQERAERITAAYLQRGDGSGAKQRGHSSGSGGRRSAPVVPVKIALPRVDSLAETIGLGFRIEGLTRGEYEFFDARPGKAKEVLASFSVISALAQTVPSIPRVEGRARYTRREITVYDLLERHAEFYRYWRGLAKWVLVDHARTHGIDRIKLIDAA